MKILFLCHGFNSLTQRLHCALRSEGHEVSVEFDINEAVTEDAIELFKPDVLIAPFLKRALPASVFEALPCFIVHPGPPGDRGPAALDWAILQGEKTWGVTVLQAVAELDAGPVWASRSFALRQASKSSLYRREVTDAAVSAVCEALEKLAAGDKPMVVSDTSSCWRPSARQKDRAIDWSNDPSGTVLRKIRSADGMPGLLDTLFDEEAYLFDARPCHHTLESNAAPGTPIARSGPALALKTVDGAVWVGHARKQCETAIKLPATTVFAERGANLAEVPGGYRDIVFEESGGVGFLSFDFYNGAMGTAACRRLLAAFREAEASSAGVLVLMGGPDHWSNGLNLNLIEAAASPAEESWQNIQAIDDLAEAVIRSTGKWIISALRGNAGAGGVFLARAADEVWINTSTVLNSHYKDMGNLYGSEFWTYLLPKYAGHENADRIAATRWPMGSEEACALGLADRVFKEAPADFEHAMRQEARARAGEDLTLRLMKKAEQRERDEAERPLSTYRDAELKRMHRNFFGFDPSYHVARYNFVRKVSKSRTPLTLATHRAAHAGARRLKRAVS